MGPCRYAPRAERAFLVALSVLLACHGDRSLGPLPPPSAQGSASRVLSCQVTIAARAVVCGDTPSSPSQTQGRRLRSDIVLGGQGVYVALRSHNVAYVADSALFRADVDVQNLTSQPLGTSDGTTVSGVRVFFVSGPTVTAGGGVVTIANADGVGTFTATNQSYFEYSEIVAPTAMSTDRTWEWNVPATVVSFSFLVLVDGNMPNESGILRWTQDASYAWNDAWLGASGFGVAVGATEIWTRIHGSWQASPQPISSGGLGTWGVDSSFAVVVGQGGEMLSYDGKSWLQQPSLTTSNLWAVSGTGRQSVFAAGENGALLHYDGASWTDASTLVVGGTHFVGKLESVWAASDTVAYLVNSAGEVYRYSVSGGWTYSGGIGTCNDGTGYSTIWGASDTSITVTCQHGHLSHYDGTSWQDWDTGSTADFYAITGTASQDLYVGGTGGVLLHWNGSTWATVTGFGTAVEHDAIEAVGATSSGSLLLASSGGALLEYNGAQWSVKEPSQYSTTELSVWGFSPTSAYVVGGNGALGSATIGHYDGYVWTQQLIPSTTLLRGVWGSSESNLFAVGAGGTILHSGDGSNWSSQTSPTDTTLYAVWGTSASDVFVVGAGGTVLRTQDGGVTWQQLATPTTQDLRGVWGSSATDVYAVGLGGVVVHFDGSSWVSEASGVSFTLRGVWGSSQSDVYVAGLSGVLHYDGSTWSVSQSGYFGTAISGTSATNIYVVGGLGPLHFNGSSWQPETGYTGVIYGIWLAGPDDGFEVGGDILHGTR